MMLSYYVRGHMNGRVSIVASVGCARLNFSMEHLKLKVIRCNEGNVPSVAVGLLDSWIERVHQEFDAHTQFITEQNKNVTKVAKTRRDQSKLSLAKNLAWAIAKTYELIGKRSPEIVAPGLQRLSTSSLRVGL